MSSRAQSIDMSEYERYTFNNLSIEEIEEVVQKIKSCPGIEQRKWIMYMGKSQNEYQGKNKEELIFKDLEEGEEYITVSTGVAVDLMGTGKSYYFRKIDGKWLIFHTGWWIS